jgi:hypothetical protein
MGAEADNPSGIPEFSLDLYLYLYSAGTDHVINALEGERLD